MKRISSMLALAAVAATLGAGVSAAAPTTASLRINHFVRGCHNWSLKGGPFRPSQVVQLARGGSLLVTNDDLMVQELVKTSGPVVVMKLVGKSQMGNMPIKMEMNGKAGPYAMGHVGAQLRVTFGKAGVYHFKLVDRGDYFKNIKTVGPDNKLTLSVTVS